MRVALVGGVANSLGLMADALRKERVEAVLTDQVVLALTNYFG
jgi:hypothetical protein